MPRQSNPAAPPAVEPSRARVRARGDRMAGVRIEFDARTVYDFLLSLATIDDLDYDLLPEDQSWLQRARASLSPQRRQDLEDCFGEAHGGLGHGLGAVPVFHPDARTAREFVTLVATMETRQLAREMTGEGLREPVTSLIDRALAGDETAFRELPEHLSEHDCPAVLEFLRTPSAWIDKLRGLLADWLVAFEPIEPRIAEIQRRDVALRRADQDTLTPADLIERTTGGLRWLPEAGIQRVILAPSYFGRPYNNVTSGPDFRLFAYPVHEDALDRADEMAPPEGVLRLYRALGDASRLRILRLLTSRDLYLTEIAQLMELSKPTVKHHLAQLRAAGLVTVIDEGNLTYYSLRRARLDEAGPELRRFLP
jgi:DNA-binding transcriptional ArsR family regulator